MAKSDTANTTVQNSATLLPTSSVAFVAMLATWLETALIVSVDRTCATIFLASMVAHIDALVAGMRLTEKWR